MGHPDFRVNNRIFATLHHDDRFGMVKLTPGKQREYMAEHPAAFAPESGAWGLQGCTRVRIDSVSEDALGEAMTLAWRGAVSATAGKRVRTTKATKAKETRMAKPIRARSGAAATRTFREVIAPYPPQVQVLAQATRAFMLELLPKVTETVDSTGPYITYGYASGYDGVVSYITVNQKGVKLGVAGGISLPDPKGLLQGSGKSNRHVVITTPADLRVAGLRQLVRAALARWKKEHA